MESNNSSKKLSTYEYYEQIQIEHLVAILRARIYPEARDKNYWNKVAEGKKRTIEDIAGRNRLPSIFTDSNLEAALSRRIYNDSTYPNFTYRDDTHRKVQEYFDLLHYYAIGTDVRFDIGLGTTHGVIKDYKPFQSWVSVETDGKEVVKVDVDKVARIL